MLVRLVIALSLVFGLLTGANAVFAQKPDSKPTKPDPKSSPVSTGTPSKPAPAKSKEPDKSRLIAITPERELLVVSFVERNHPELAGLLAHLKTNQPKEYDRAVRDLFRVTEKLAMVHERDSRQYDLELKAWKAQSRAQLLVARLKMTEPETAESDELKKQLREILADQVQARLDVMKLERERVAGRLDKLNDDIERLEKDRDSVIEGHVKALTGQVNANRPKPKTPDNKPARKP